MLVYMIRRMGQSVFAVAVMAVLVFVGVYAIGNPVDILISAEATELDREAQVIRLGLDKPLWEQFFIYIANMAHGDLGNSFVYGTPAMTLILQRLPATMELALVALSISVLFGVPLGMIAGLRPDTGTGRSIMAGSILGFSLPNFWQGMMLILIFAVILGWLPAGGRGTTVDVLGMPLSISSCPPSIWRCSSCRW
jgi:peptide/nickel transport system permease protein